jgi:phenylalanine-4-hydroxylase
MANRILTEIGWAAVAVDGFIPPNAFMEFQAYNVLVIASDIRQLEHIEYTPAPDIIHEGAGHANYRESRICRIFTSFWRNRLQSHFI